MPLPNANKHNSEIPLIPHENCWAKTDHDKPGISVAQHGRTTGIIAQQLCQTVPEWLRASLRTSAGIVLAALHDVGKISPGFQRQCSAWLQKHNLPPLFGIGHEEDHGKISQRTLQEMLKDEKLFPWAVIVGAHHGLLKNNRIPPLADGGEGWEAERKRLIHELMNDFGPLPDGLMDSENTALWYNAGLIAVSDWLASDERMFPPSQKMEEHEIRKRALVLLEKIGFRARRFSDNTSFGDLFPKLKGGPNPLQKSLMNIVTKPGIFVVEAPMGSGKTEAALAAAAQLIANGQAAGLYFALPTQATSNSIHTRVKEFIARLSPDTPTHLIHSASWLHDSSPAIQGRQCANQKNGEYPFEGTNWFASPRRALLAPFGVGTVDQALLGTLAVKHFFVRLFGLAGKVVILDEVHSYDLYTGTLVDRLIKRLQDAGSTIIILSATLTAARRAQLLGCPSDSYNSHDQQAYPLISARIGDKFIEQPVPLDSSKKVRILFDNYANLLEQAIQKAKEGLAVLWIRNSVADAQETYRHLCGNNHEGGPEIGLLHSRFPHFRRITLENLWLERLGKEPVKRPPKGCILVATQVMEQSVDVDADLLISDLAPTDMLLQRIGRLWRHSRPRPKGCNTPECRIVLPALDLLDLFSASTFEIQTALGRSGKVYAPYLLLRSLHVWRSCSFLHLPNDIRPLLERTYEPLPAEPPGWVSLRKELESQRDQLQCMALSNSNIWNLLREDEEGVLTRWAPRPTAFLLIATHVHAYDSKIEAQLTLLNGETITLERDKFVFATAQSIHRNLIQVPRWCLKQLFSETPAWATQYVRKPLALLCLDGETLRTIPTGQTTNLIYREDYGLAISSCKLEGARVSIQPYDGFEDESCDW